MSKMKIGIGDILVETKYHNKLLAVEITRQGDIIFVDGRGQAHSSNPKWEYSKRWKHYSIGDKDNWPFQILSDIQTARLMALFKRES